MTPAARGEAGESSQKVAANGGTITGSSELGSAIDNDRTYCSMYQRNLFRSRLRENGTRVFHGTNFRHAVEFSRSGRAPSRLFRAGRGQPEIHYPVGFAGSNTIPHRPELPLGRGVDAVRHRRMLIELRAWGTSARLRHDRSRPFPTASASPSREQRQH